jgi:hypothetical protein
VAGTQYNRDAGATYFSASRKTEIPIADETQFNDFHLVAAFTKLKSSVQAQMGGENLGWLDSLCDMARELGYRDLLEGHKGGRPPGDPRLPMPEVPVDVDRGEDQS